MHDRSVKRRITDIQVIASAGAAFGPYSGIQDAIIPGIAVQAALGVPLQISAMCACGDGIGPAVYSRGVQMQVNALGVFLRAADSVVDIEHGV